MSKNGYWVMWTGSALLAMGMVAGCDAGQQQDPGAPATEDEAGDNLAMYEPDDTAGDPAGTTADDPATATDPGMGDDPMMGADRAQDPGMAGGDLESMNPDEIVGKSVTSQTGEEIGSVDEIVTDPTSNQKFAVVDVGGFLGVGEKSIVIPLSELQTASGGQDRLESDLTREELQAETEYSPGDYESLTGDADPQDPTQQ